MKTALFLAALLLALTPHLSSAQEKKSKAAPTKARNAKAPADPFAPDSKGPSQRAYAGVRILCEWIEVDHADFSEWLQDHRIESDATALRHWLQERVRKGRAIVVDTMIVGARSGQRASVASTKEIIYPTRYEKMSLPESVHLEDGAEAPVTLPIPTAFETRTTGGTLEIDAVIAAGGEVIDLNLIPEIVTQLEDREILRGEIGEDHPMPMPHFHRAAITTSVSIPNGGYTLLGTTRLPKKKLKKAKSPITLVLVRADAY